MFTKRSLVRAVNDTRNIVTGSLLFWLCVLLLGLYCGVVGVNGLAEAVHWPIDPPFLDEWSHSIGGTASALVAAGVVFLSQFIAAPARNLREDLAAATAGGIPSSSTTTPIGVLKSELIRLSNDVDKAAQEWEPQELSGDWNGSLLRWDLPAGGSSEQLLNVAAARRFGTRFRYLDQQLRLAGWPPEALLSDLAIECEMDNTGHMRWIAEKLREIAEGMPAGTPSPSTAPLTRLQKLQGASRAGVIADLRALRPSVEIAVGTGSMAGETHRVASFLYDMLVEADWPVRSGGTTVTNPILEGISLRQRGDSEKGIARLAEWLNSIGCPAVCEDGYGDDVTVGEAQD